MEMAKLIFAQQTNMIPAITALAPILNKVFGVIDKSITDKDLALN